MGDFFLAKKHMLRDRSTHLHASLVTKPESIRVNGKLYVFLFYIFCRWDACSHWHMPSHLDNSRSRSNSSSRILLFSFSYTLPDAMQFYELGKLLRPFDSIDSMNVLQRKACNVFNHFWGVEYFKISAFFWFLSTILDLMIEFSRVHGSHFILIRWYFHLNNFSEISIRIWNLNKMKRKSICTYSKMLSHLNLLNC